jgi:hypothetical protein
LWTPERWQSVMAGEGEREFEAIRQATERGLPLGDRDFVLRSNAGQVERQESVPLDDRVLFCRYCPTFLDTPRTS